VVGAPRGVLLCSTAELRRHVHEHPVGQPKRFEVALEGEQRVCGQLQPFGEVAGLVSVWVPQRPKE